MSFVCLEICHLFLCLKICGFKWPPSFCQFETSGSGLQPSLAGTAEAQVPQVLQAWKTREDSRLKQLYEAILEAYEMRQWNTCIVKTQILHTFTDYNSAPHTVALWVPGFPHSMQGRPWTRTTASGKQWICY